MPALVDKVSALRRFFGTPHEVELLPAIVAMNAMMGIVAEGTLPVQVDKLIAATGVSVGEMARRRSLAGWVLLEKADGDRRWCDGAMCRNGRNGRFLGTAGGLTPFLSLSEENPCYRFLT